VKEVYEFQKRCGTFTCNRGGNPAGAHIGRWTGSRQILHQPQIKRLRPAYESNPKVEICAWRFGEGSASRPTAVRDERREAKHIADANPMLNPCTPRTTTTTSVLFQDATATISSFTSEPKVIRIDSSDRKVAPPTTQSARASSFEKPATLCSFDKSQGKASPRGAQEVTAWQK
jgi:hypothetical protein